MAAAASSTRCATPSATVRRDLQGRRKRAADAERGGMTQRVPIAGAAAASIAPRPLRFTLRRPRLRGLRRRHAGLGAARQRRAPGRPLVQVSPAARHPGGRRRRSRTRWWRSTAAPAASTPNIRATQVGALRRPGRATARTAGRRCAFDLGAVNDLFSRRSCRPASTTRPSCGRASWKQLYEPIDPRRRRARDVRRRSPIRTATPSASRIATCWSSAPAGGPRGGAGRRRAGARVILCDEQARIRRQPARRDRRARSTASRGWTGWRDAWRELRHAPNVARAAADDRLRLLRAEFRRPLPNASTDHLAAPPPARRASGCGRCARARWCLRTGRDRAAAGVSGQRPPRHHAGRRARSLPATATACKRRLARRRRHRQRQRLSHGARRCTAPASRSRAIVDLRDDADRAACDARAPQGIECSPARTVPAPQGALGSSTALISRGARGGAQRDASPATAC